MFKDWKDNLALLIEDTYGDPETPFAVTYDELRQMYEAGLSEAEALARLAGELIASVE
jgi:hypothetical protein